MPFDNPPRRQMEEQRRLEKEMVLLKLGEIKDSAWVPGNDSGETSQIIRIEKAFMDGQITAEKALMEAGEIVAGKNLR